MKRFHRGVTVLLASLLLASCAVSADLENTSAQPADDTPLTELDVLDDPKAYEGHSTAQLVHSEIEPVLDDPAQSLPVQIASKDRSGDLHVTVTDTSRVLALDMSGSIAATVWGLGFGETLVGRDTSTTFPGAEHLPKVTSSGHSINAEAVLALDPTLIITDGSIGPRDVVEQLRDAGVTVVFIDDAPSFEGAVNMTRDVAAIFGAPEAGELLAAQLAQDIERTKAEIAAFAPADDDEKLRMVFLYLRGTSGVYYIFGQESGASDLISGLGGVDVATELGWSDMQPLTDEAMVAADPDLILVMSGGIESTAGIDGLIADRQAIGLTTAGQKKRFVDMADGEILSFGPRSADVLAALARAVYAPTPAP